MVMKQDVALLSKAGGRKINEDYCRYLCCDGYCCYLLADGLGGHKGGNIAAKTLGEAVIEAFTASPGMSYNSLVSYLDYARHTFSAVCNSGQYRNMKATLVVLLTDSRRAYWGHIGDSRLYYFKAGRLCFQTSDHSVPQKLADSGEISYDQIRFHEDRNRLTAAFDGESLNRFEFLDSPLETGENDAFLLCSDGFWEYITEEEMERDLSRAPSALEWLLMMEKTLVERAKTGHDNYSALSLLIS